MNRIGRPGSRHREAPPAGPFQENPRRATGPPAGSLLPKAEVLGLRCDDLQGFALTIGLGVPAVIVGELLQKLLPGQQRNRFSAVAQATAPGACHGQSGTVAGFKCRHVFHHQHTLAGASSRTVAVSNWKSTPCTSSAIETWARRTPASSTTEFEMLTSSMNSNSSASSKPACCSCAVGCRDDNGPR